jgi:hypothetical protein
VALAYGHGKNDGGTAAGPLATTLEDFFQPGTQPLNNGGKFAEIVSATACTGCHANYGTQDPFLVVEPYKTWASSMMGQSARDPVFYAALTLANQNADQGGAYCIRCHVPSAYLGGRAGVEGQPTDGSNFTEMDLQGVSCNGAGEREPGSARGEQQPIPG